MTETPDEQETPEPSREELEKSLRKLERRQKRNQRAAWADGFLTAACGMLRPGDLAIDCGANIGDVSARLLQSGADVLAIDAEPWAVQRLEERFAKADRFRLINAAIGTAEGKVTLRRADNFKGNEKGASVKSTILEGGRRIDDETSVEVQLVDFRKVLQKELETRDEIAFIKMSIEGAELDLIEAMHRDGLLKRVRCMVAETHERKFGDLRPRYKALRKMIAETYDPSHISLEWI